ncbi:unnamed protein product [Linum tenue]|uniref:Uncharacterized protein n=1 Tax=Linum tenue TaxID=586396 RepID=A0AAV0LYN9_9ROSI|nr:unnamed protein product [Linum tenue]
MHPLPPPPPLRATSSPEAGENGGAVSVVKGKKKAGGARLWMRFDRFGNSELVECDKNAIIKRVALPAMGFEDPRARLLSLLQYSWEKAMVVNLEFIGALATAEDFGSPETRGDGHTPPVTEAADGEQPELPFEFQVLEIALEVMCSYLDSSVAGLGARCISYLG